MSTTVDQRVVEMEFDNRNFESNVKQSMNTLDKLKNALNFKGVSKGLEEIDQASRNMGFEVMGNAIDSVKQKFSAFDVIAVTALMNITNKVVDAGERLAKSLSIDQVTAGWSKYEDKVTAVQTIMSATNQTWQENADAVGFAGSQMEFVDEQLEKLNWFSDETSYSFTDMTSNIGKFTASGVALTDAVTAMEGISTWAAISGQNTQSASRAMYNLAQAISVGSVKLMDWKSIENANMATMEFKQTAIDSAVALGTLKKKQDGVFQTLQGHTVTVENFNEALKDEWFTSEVLMDSLNSYGKAATKLSEISEEYGVTATQFLSNFDKYRAGTITLESAAKNLGMTVGDLSPLIEELSSDEYELSIRAFKAAQEAKTFTEAIDATKDAVSTGWMKTFELIFGNYEQSKEIWTELANRLWDVFAAGGEARNEILELWAAGTGRKDLIDGIWALWDAIDSLISPIKEAFGEIFPSTIESTATKLQLITKKFKYFAQSLMLNEETAEKVKETFKGIFSVVKIVFNVFKSLVKAISDVVGYLFGFKDSLLDVTAGLGRFVTGIQEGVEASNIFGKIFDTISNSVIGVGKILTGFGGPVLSSFWQTLKNVGNKIVDTIKYIFSALGNGIKGVKIESVIDIINKGLFASLLLSVNKFFKNFTKTFSSGMSVFEKLNSIADSITGIFDQVGGAIKTWQQSIKADIILKIASAIGILVLSLTILSSIEKDKLTTAISAITMMFSELIVSIHSLKKVSISKAIGQMGLLISLSISLLILSVALKSLSKLNTNEIENGLEGVFGLIGILTASMLVLSARKGKILKGTAGMVLISAAVVILSRVVKYLGEMDEKVVWQGILAVGALMALIDIFLLAERAQGMKAITTATGIVIIAAAITILESSIEKLGKMKLESLVKGVVAMGILLGEIGIFTRIASSSAKVVASGLLMIMFAKTMELIYPVFEQLGHLSWDDLSKGLIAIAASLSTFALASKFLSIIGVFGIMAVVGSMQDMVNAFTAMSNISWDDVIRSLSAMGAAMLLFAGVSKVLDDSAIGDTFAISIAMTSVALAMKLLSSIDVIGAVVGLSTLAGAFIILGTSVKLLSPMTKNILKLSGSISVMCASLILLGGSLAALGIGLGVFATNIALAFLELQLLDWGAIAKGFIVLVGAFTVLGVAAKILKPLTGSMLALAGTMLAFGISLITIGLALSLIASGIVTLSLITEEGARNVGITIRSIIEGIAGAIPYVIKSVGEGIVEVIKLIGDSAVEIVNAVEDILVAVLHSMAELIPLLSDTIVTLTLSVLDLLIKFGPKIIDKLIDLIVIIIEGLTARLPELVSKISEFFKQLFSAIFKEMGDTGVDDILKIVLTLEAVAILMRTVSGLHKIIVSAMLGMASLGAFIAELTLILAAIGAISLIPGLNWIITQGAELLGGIGYAIGALIGGLAGGIADWFSKSLPDMAKNLSDFMINLKPFLEGVREIDTDVLSGVFNLSSALIMITAANLINGITSFLLGSKSIESFGEQLIVFGHAMNAYSKEVSGIDSESVKASAIAGKALTSLANTVPNSGGIVSWFTGNNDIDDFGLKIMTFGAAMKSYSKSVSGIDSEAVQASAVAGKALTSLADTIPNTGGIVSWFTGDNDIDDFAYRIVPFGKAMKKYSMAVKGIDGKAISDSAIAGKALTSLAKTIPNSDGVIGWFAGNNDMDKFGAMLVPFGEAMKDYSNVIQGIDESAIINSAIAGEALAKIQNNLAPIGGVVEWFNGGQDLALFGQQLIPFGEALKLYSNSVTDLETEPIINSANAAEGLVNLQNSLEPIGGLISWFAGDQDLASFGTQLPLFGACLRAYSDSITEDGGIDARAIYDSGWAATGLSNLQKNLSKEGGIIAWFAGEKNLEIFGTHLESFGNSLNTYGESVADLNVGAIVASASAAKNLADIQSTLDPIGGIVSWIEGEKSLSTFGEQLSSFGSALVGYGDAVKDLNIKAVDNAVFETKKLIKMVKEMEGIDYNSSQGFIESFNNLPNASIDYFVMCFTNSIDRVKKASKGLLDAFEETIEDNKWNIPIALVKVLNLSYDEMALTVKTFKKIGSLAITNIIDGYASMYEDLGTASAKLVNMSYNTLHALLYKFKGYGKNIVDGIIGGINDEISHLSEAASHMGKAITGTFQMQLGIHSPSKVFEQFGNYIVQGLSKGIDDTAYLADHSMSNIGEVMTDIVSKINDQINSDLEDDIVVRPILDLTNVNSELNTLDRRLSATKSIELSRGLDVYSNTNRGIISEASTTLSLDLTRQFGELKDEVANLNSAISRMQIVMDTGAMVGALTPGVDSALGNRFVLAGRGV